MQVLNITEKDDGTVDIELDATQDEYRMLLQIGLSTLLKEYAVEYNKPRSECGEGTD